MIKVDKKVVDMMCFINQLATDFIIIYFNDFFVFCFIDIGIIKPFRPRRF